VAADVAFHLGIAEAAGNETLLGIMTSVRSLLQVWISRVMRGTVDHMVSAQEHVPILEAIEAGDAQAARAAMERHMAWALSRLEETLAQEDRGPSRDDALVTGAPSL
jgi:GntR family transcriptional repressor for pyruvate dehydrogenase complex